jgi:DNA-binding PadR family transcriptional regulator
MKDEEQPPRLSPPMFQVMVALADDDRHGYAIMKEVETRTDGATRLTASTLYGIIKRLLADRLIVETTARVATPADDPRRRYYRLTSLGRRVALAEAERMERSAAIARSVLTPRTLRTQG